MDPRKLQLWIMQNIYPGIGVCGTCWLDEAPAKCYAYLCIQPWIISEHVKGLGYRVSGKDVLALVKILSVDGLLSYFGTASALILMKHSLCCLHYAILECCF